LYAARHAQEEGLHERYKEALAALQKESALPSRYIREHLNHFLVLYLRDLYAFSAIKALATTLPSIVLGFEIGSDARLLLP
jgi:hypothetical protein|tara:strand:- start:683 stop:925 length:243 start_codon:yes stop_codon:yes gene_type:complete